MSNSERLGEVYYKGKILEIMKTGYYVNNRIAIGVMEEGIPFATITVNLPREKLEEGEFFVKDWFENEEITPHILEHTDLFEDTGKRVPTGLVEAPIWRFNDG